MGRNHGAISRRPRSDCHRPMKPPLRRSLPTRWTMPLGSYARHYYDSFQLSELAEVPKMLRSEEYATIKTDYDQISKAHFSRATFFLRICAFPAAMRSFRHLNSGQSSARSTKNNPRCFAMDPTLHGPRCKLAFLNCETFCEHQFKRATDESKSRPIKKYS